MITFLIILGIVGLILFIVGMTADLDYDFPMFVVGLVMFMVGLFGTIGVSAYRSDVNHCEKITPQTTGYETKWLSGECYAKAKDGKFVPLEWIEEGYDR